MKIVIVGGGTAAWIAASFLLKDRNPLIQLAVIESPNIPIIGAGEGATGLFSGFILNDLKGLGSNVYDFVNDTESTFKFGIRFKNWKGDGSEYFHPIHKSITEGVIGDTNFLFNLKKGTPHLTSFGGHVLQNGSSPYLRFENKLIPFQSDKAYTFNFDGIKVGQYLKKLCNNLYKHYSGNVVDITTNPTGYITSLKMDNGVVVEGDLFLDCTGFERVLSKKMNNKWIDYSNELPLNSTILYQRPHNDETILPETLAMAHPNGWMFQVPTQTRFGTGYVYCDDFINDTDALAEHIRVVGRDVIPAKQIKFKTGKLDKVWDKNVLSIGLSASFLEPLQATSIHTTLVQLNTFYYMFMRNTIEETISNFNISTYNRRIDSLLDGFKSLAQIHYISGRDDTPFWRAMQNEIKITDFNKNILDVCKYRIPAPTEFGFDMGGAGWAVWCWTLAGNGIITKEQAINEMKRMNILNQENRYMNEEKEMRLYTLKLMPNDYFVKNILKTGKFIENN